MRVLVRVLVVVYHFDWCCEEWRRPGMVVEERMGLLGLIRHCCCHCEDAVKSLLLCTGGWWHAGRRTLIKTDATGSGIWDGLDKRDRGLHIQNKNTEKD